MHNVLVVDDEILARETVKVLLAHDKDIGIIWEADDAQSALEISHAKSPDIVILDIEMPGLSGIELAKKLPLHCVIVFASAFSEFALPAFEVNAIDYLLKPFSDERFFESIARAKERLAALHEPQSSALSSAVLEFIEQHQNTYKKRIIIKDPGRIRFVDIDQIAFITGAGNYAELHMLDGSHFLHRETLSNLEHQLNPKDFVRIHRSSIVRRDCIAELRPNEKGDYAVILDSGEKLTMSRRNRDKINELTH
ncbi:LytTR family DNA-binding domain-containing protein [Alteromonas ponticola]|uniref:LytTR family DNA-binding domain-containing protein n=1 Tax=Alteromonas aquimaris TaxID=2998417 RepID=A0ABT3PAJ7_9ALTE|nr:LytTR family DNA-binding domain-containing protein [Alteromonas aquimaris]MCW8109799.1 LytTR family DNA-binding domain-containing protein [Alteromonas aquimaris]